MITLSFSAASKFLLSPRAWYLHYIKRLRPVQLASPLIFGSSLDAGINSLLLDMKNEDKPDLEKAKKAFVDTFSTTEVEGEIKNLWEPGIVKFSKSDYDESLIGEEIGDKDPSWISLKNKGLIIISEYAQQVLPKIKQVHEVQYPVEVINENMDKFIGVVDLIATMDNGKKCIMDNKSSAKAYTENSANDSEQLQTYFEILKDEMKLDALGFIVYSKSVRKKKLPRVEMQIIFGTSNEDLTNATFQRYDEVIEGIKAENFPCTPNKCCEKAWMPCPYKNYCTTGDMTGLKVFKERK